MAKIYAERFNTVSNVNERSSQPNRVAVFLLGGYPLTGKLNLNEQAQEILKIAEKHGVEQNFFFITTFKRYQVQLKILNELEKAINDGGVLVTKQYVKGRENIYSHPAIADYNRTTDSANRTVMTLVKIITNLRPDTAEDEDELLKFLREH